MKRLYFKHESTNVVAFLQDDKPVDLYNLEDDADTSVYTPITATLVFVCPDTSVGKIHFIYNKTLVPVDDAKSEEISSEPDKVKPSIFYPLQLCASEDKDGLVTYEKTELRDLLINTTLKAALELNLEENSLNTLKELYKEDNELISYEIYASKGEDEKTINSEIIVVITINNLDVFNNCFRFKDESASAYTIHFDSMIESFNYQVASITAYNQLLEVGYDVKDANVMINYVNNLYRFLFIGAIERGYGIKYKDIAYFINRNMEIAQNQENSRKESEENKASQEADTALSSNTKEENEVIEKIVAEEVDMDALYKAKQQEFDYTQASSKEV